MRRWRTFEDPRAARIERILAFIRLGGALLAASLAMIGLLDAGPAAWGLVALLGVVGAIGAAFRPEARVPLATLSAASAAFDTAWVLAWVVTRAVGAAPSFIALYVAVVVFALRYALVPTLAYATGLASAVVILHASASPDAPWGESPETHVTAILILGLLGGLLAEERKRERSGRLGESRRADEAEAARARFLAVVEHSPAPIALTDVSGRVVLANLEAARSFRSGEGALQGQPFDAFLAPNAREKYRAALAQVALDPDARTARLHVTGARNGDEFPAELSLARTSRAGEDLVVHSWRDTTAEVAAGARAAEAERALLEASERAFDGLAIEQDGAVLAANEPLCAMVNRRKEEIVAADGLAVVFPDHAEALRGVATAVDAKPTPALARRKDGSRVNAIVRASAIKLNGRPARLYTIRDASAVARAATRVDALGTLAGVLRNARDEDQVVAAGLASIMQGLGSACGQTWRPMRGAPGLATRDGWETTSADYEPLHEVSRELRQRGVEAVAGRAWATRHAVWIADASTDPTFERRDVLERLRLRAALAIPVAAEGETIAVYELFFREAREESAEDVAFAMSCASLVAATVRAQRARADIAILAAERQAILAASPDPVLLLDARGLVLACDGPVADAFGRPASELVGARIDDLLSASNGASFLARIADATADKPAATLAAAQATRANGATFPADVTAARVPGASGGYVATVRDATRRIAADRARREAESLAETLATASRDAVLRLAPDGTIRYASPATSTLLGHAPESIRGASLLDYAHPADRAALADDLDRACRRSDAVSGRARFHTRSSEAVWAEFTLRAGRDASGRALEVVASLRDATERERARSDLDEAREEARRASSLLESTLEGSPDGVLVVDADGRILARNARFAELLHVPEEAMRTGSHDVVLRYLATTSESPVAVLDRVGDLHRADAARATDVIRLMDGRSIERTSAPYEAPGRPTGGRVWYYRDATERERAVAEAARAADRLAELDVLKTRFLNTTAHEIATPLTPIKLQLHALKKRWEAEGQSSERNAIEVIERNVDRITFLVRDMLDVARLQSGRLAVEFGNVDVDALAREAAAAFTDAAALRRVDVRVRARGAGTIEGDRERLLQVVHNLVSNGIKFTPPGGKVTIETERAGSRVRLRVRDTGVGLTEDDVRKLFRPFTQIHDSLVRPTEGVGLGLYIARAIVAEHAGALTCASDGPGHGSVFTVELPTRMPEERDADGAHAGADAEGTPRRDARSS